MSSYLISKVKHICNLRNFVILLVLVSAISLTKTAEAEEPLPEDIFSEYRQNIFKFETDEEKLAKEQEMYMIEEARKSDYGIILSKERIKNSIGYNCVAFVRSKVIDLPQNLYTLEDKKEIINKSEPEEGAVAITDEGHVGHVSIVKEIKENTLVIEESNFISGYKTERLIDKNLPVGYWIN